MGINFLDQVKVTFLHFSESMFLVIRNLRFLDVLGESGFNFKNI